MKEPKYFLDSNIFLRPIVKDDVRKVEECELLFEKIKRGKIKCFTSNLVLAEIVWVSKSIYGLRKEEIIKILKGIFGFKYIKFINNFNPLLAVEIFQNFDVKFIDALIASNPRIYQKKITVVSYDTDFDKLDIIRKEPEKIVKE